MKKLMVIVALITLIVNATQAQDSTCYFASWYSSNGWFVKNTVVKVPSSWTFQKVEDVVREKDRFIVSIEYFKKVPNEIYVESLIVDSLVPKTNTGPDVKNAIRTEWYVEYAILDSDRKKQGQIESKVIMTGNTQTFHPRQVEKYIKESEFTDPKIRIVIISFQKK